MAMKSAKKEFHLASISPHQDGHPLKLIFGRGMELDLITKDEVLWSDHVVMKIQLDVLPTLV